MNSRWVGVRWWLIFCCMVAGLVVSAGLGTVDLLWEKDRSKLSFVILTLCFVVSPFIGYITHRAEKGDFDFAYTHWHSLKYSMQIMVLLGLLGTLFGIFWTSDGNLANIDVTNATMAQKILAVVNLGITTATLTSIVGIICSAITYGQLVNLRYLLPRSK